MEKKQSKLSKQGRAATSASIGSYSPTIPDVVGKTRLEAIRIFFNAGVDYLLSYVSQGATAQNNDIVASQVNDGIATIYVYQYVQPQGPVNVTITFTSGEDPDYVQAPYEPYNPYPNSGIVVGSVPSTADALSGTYITLPTQGDLQLIERQMIFSNVGGGTYQRQVPDQIVYPSFLGWTDGNAIYQPGTQYLVPNTNITMSAVWSTIVYSPAFDSFTPESGSVGTIITITGKKLAEVSDVYFNRFKQAEFTVLNDNTVQAIVPEGATTGMIRIYTSSGGFAVNFDDFIII